MSKSGPSGAPARRRVSRAEILLPVAIGGAGLLAWQAVVSVFAIPHYILPGPWLVAVTLWSDWGTLWPALLVTLEVTFLALAAAVAGGVALAFLFAQSKWIELGLFPYAIVLQVTPIIAIAPLILIYVDNTHVAMVLCAGIVAFFPILANTTLGLNSADHNLVDLFRLHGATRWQTLRYLRVPTALPYFFGGLRIAGGLALIGAVVAEFTAGTAGRGAGLAFRILEAGYRLNIPRMFAALVLVTASGIAIFAAMTALSNLALRRWHESAVTRDT